MNILITGANGQLGQCFKHVVLHGGNVKNVYYFADKTEVDITNIESIKNIIDGFDVVINCAAYTNVERAEDDESGAYRVNVDGVRNLVEVCKKNNTQLIHISTDFVFNGTENCPYREYDNCLPVSVYGRTKYEGETIALNYKHGSVIRTSWLYSEFGKNFYKTMLSRIRNNKDTRVVSDQIGTPTYARDLAKFICDRIDDESIKTMKGIYHFTNNGCCSWYDFAKAIEIFDQGIDNKNIIKPCSTYEYPCKAKRPKYSVLSKERIGVQPRHWMEALAECMIFDSEENIIEII